MASSLSLYLLIIFLKIPDLKNVKECKVIEHCIFILINYCSEILSYKISTRKTTFKRAIFIVWFPRSCRQKMINGFVGVSVQSVAPYI